MKTVVRMDQPISPNYAFLISVDFKEVTYMCVLKTQTRTDWHNNTFKKNVAQ